MGVKTVITHTCDICGHVLYSNAYTHDPRLPPAPIPPMLKYVYTFGGEWKVLCESCAFPVNAARKLLGIKLTKEEPVSDDVATPEEIL